MRSAALLRLLRGELRGRRLRAMLLFVVVVALASAALVGGLEGQTKANDRWDAAFAEANGAHVTIDGPPAAVAAVAGRPEVAAATHPYRRSAEELDVVLDGEPVVGAVAREVSRSDLPEIARPLLRDGRWIDPAADDEVVLDRAFAIDEGVDVGDEIGLATEDGPVSFTVVGRAVDLVDCFYPNCDPVTVWVDPAGFSRLGVDAIQMTFLRLHDADAVEPFMAALSDAGVGTQDWLDTRADTLGAYEVLGAFLGAFGVFVMIAAAVVVGSSMATRAVARRHEIGLLKAVGTTPRQVTASIVLSHAVAAAVGVAGGWVLGGFLAPVTQVSLGETLGTGGAAFSGRGLVTAFLVVEAIVVVTTVIPAWRAGRVPTTVALAPVPPHRTRGRFLGSAHLSPVAVAGVRGTFGRPARSLLTALALALALVGVLATVGVDRSVDRIFGDLALVGDPEELRVYPTADAAAIPAVLDGDPGVASWFTETDQDLVLGDETFLGIAIGGDVEQSGFVVGEGRMLAGPGEAVAGWGLLDRFGLDVGDRVTVVANGRPIELTIVGWYREGEDTGQILRFSFDDLRDARPDAEPAWVSVNVADGESPEAVAASLADALDGIGQIEVRSSEGSDEIDAFGLAFRFVAGLVVIVALANLASTMLLAVRERTHDLGVLRAVGVTPRQVVAIVAAGAAVLALLAAVIGVPLAWLASDAITEVVGAEAGLGPGIGAGPGIATAIVVVPLLVALAALLGALAARRGARAEVSELVRYE
jgi:putative ABC transport system permease protein